MTLAIGMQNSITLEHLVPKSQGGSNTRENIRGACFRCNQSRGVIPVKHFMEIAENFPIDQNPVGWYKGGVGRNFQGARLRERADKKEAREAALSGIDNPFEINSRKWRMFEKIVKKLDSTL